MKYLFLLLLASCHVESPPTASMVNAVDWMKAEPYLYFASGKDNKSVLLSIIDDKGREIFVGHMTCDGKFLKQSGPIQQALELLIKMQFHGQVKFCR